VTTNHELEARRLAILRILQCDNDYSVNDNIVSRCLKDVGHGVALDVVRGDFSWLSSQGLISVTRLPHCHVATLRSLGLDVAEGVAEVPGVARKRPD